MPGADRLQQLGLFTDVAPGTLTAICADVDEIRLEAGQILFHEGDLGDRAYVVVEGSLEIVKHSEGHDVVLAVHGPGEVVGEMALLRATPRTATVKARDAAVLVGIPKTTFDDLLASSPEAARAVFTGLVTRMDDTAEQLRHNERMAQLGTLTAGIAHELNNPAAAVQRAASSLEERLDHLIAMLLNPVGDGGRARAAVWSEVASRSSAVSFTTALGALERSDLDDAVADLLDAHGVDDGWRIASELVDAGFDLAGLRNLLISLAEMEREHGSAHVGSADDVTDGVVLRDALAFAAAAAEVRALVRGITDASGRLSHIVAALKGYAYLDRAPVQDVDVVEGLESTLVLLGHKLGGVVVERDYEDGLPRITAVGGDINQVWTNLIDNAADALADGAANGPGAATDGETKVPAGRPTLRLVARSTDDEVIVEVSDNGPGIPEETRRKMFDAFFTTKPPGSGTGLGLSTTHRIVVKEHHGRLECVSRPGNTTFTVTLPRHGPGPDVNAVTSSDESDRHS